MNLAKLLKAVIDDETTGYQMLHECAISATQVKANKKKHKPPYTRVCFGTQEYSPVDAMMPGRAQKVGVIIWIPLERYNALARSE